MVNVNQRTPATTTKPNRSRPAPRWALAPKEKARMRRRIRANAKTSRYWHYRPEAPDAR